MANKQPTRRRSDQGPVNALGWRRLPGSSRNYRNVSDPRQTIGTTISERQMANLSREARLGRKITKEAYKKKGRKRRIIICRRDDAIATDQCQKQPLHSRISARHRAERQSRRAQVLSRSLCRSFPRRKRSI